MYHFFVEPDQIREDCIFIIGQDVNHIRNVLRMKAGEEISVSDGCGKTYECVIKALEPEQIIAGIENIVEQSSELKTSITLFQGLPKGDKMETIIQKCVELGVARIVPVKTRRTIVKLDDKKASAKIKRWNSISEGAAKQSGRGVVPEVTEVVSFGEALGQAKAMDVAVIPYELARDMAKTRAVLQGIGHGNSVAVFIGPEGGFEAEEVEQAMAAGVIPITLGRRILRTETAGMALLAMLVLLLEE